MKDPITIVTITGQYKTKDIPFIASALGASNDSSLKEQAGYIAEYFKDQIVFKITELSQNRLEEKLEYLRSEGQKEIENDVLSFLGAHIDIEDDAVIEKETEKR